MAAGNYVVGKIPNEMRSHEFKVAARRVSVLNCEVGKIPNQIWSGMSYSIFGQILKVSAQRELLMVVALQHSKQFFFQI
jgi:hypothetical protein